MKIANKKIVSLKCRNCTRSLTMGAKREENKRRKAKEK
jgi:hypothetical protein